MLGICYGGQLIARDLGGEVAKTGRGEYGRTDLDRRRGGTLFGFDVPADQVVWMSHFDTITRAPEGFSVLASTGSTPAAAVRVAGRASTPCSSTPRSSTRPTGRTCSSTSSTTPAGCRPTWTMTSIIEQQVEAVRAQVGTGRAICGLSGGVDSAVAAALVHKAIGPS